jgi:hypothetical protein
MKEIKLVLKIKPFSINAMFAKSRGFTTAKYKDWSYQVFHQLDTEENLKKMAEFKEEFDPLVNCIHLHLKSSYPKSVFIKKAGGISSRTHDISNIEKPLIDLIFDEKYEKKPSPYGCKNLAINDKFITKMISEKLISDDEDYRIEIDLSIQDLQG